MKYVRQVAIIMSVSFVAELMEFLIPLPIAASVYGLVLMLAALMSGIVKLKEVEAAGEDAKANLETEMEESITNTKENRKKYLDAISGSTVE